MNTMGTYLASVAATLAFSIVVVAYLHRSLSTTLVDLCGIVERANFWTAFSNVTLVLVPLIFALHHGDSGEGQRTQSLIASTYQFADQLAQSLAGLMISVLVLGFVLSRFISRNRVEPDPKVATTSAS
jgi:cytochrome c biogenesis protein CcdA